MPIKAACSCGHAFSAPSAYAGKKVKCPKCKNPLMVPAEGKASGKPSKSSSKKIRIQCDCGKTVQVKAELAGKKVKCPGCGKPLLVKAKQRVAKETSDGGDPMQSLFAEAGLTEQESGGRKCPECRSPMKPEAILCIECGYNENLGRKMTVKRPVTAEDRVQRAADRHPDPVAESAKGKKKKGGPKQLVLVVVLVAAVAVIYFVMKSRGGS